MLQGEHSAILSTFNKLPFAKIFVLSIFEWLLYTGFIVFKMRSLVRFNQNPANIIHLRLDFIIEANITPVGLYYL